MEYQGDTKLWTGKNIFHRRWGKDVQKMRVSLPYFVLTFLGVNNPVRTVG